MSIINHDQMEEEFILQQASIGGDPSIYTKWKKRKEKERAAREIEKAAILPFTALALAKISLFTTHKAEIYIDTERLLFRDLEDPAHSFSLTNVELKSATIWPAVFSMEIAIHLPNGVKHRFIVPKIPNVDSFRVKEIYAKAIENARKSK